MSAELLFACEVARCRLERLSWISSSKRLPVKQVKEPPNFDSKAALERRKKRDV